MPAPGSFAFNCYELLKGDVQGKWIGGGADAATATAAASAFFRTKQGTSKLDIDWGVIIKNGSGVIVCQIGPKEK